MKGLLRRLARRVADPTVPTIHSRARLPYIPLAFDGMDTPAPEAVASKQAKTVVEAAQSHAAGLSAPFTKTRIARDEHLHETTGLSSSQPAIERPLPASGTDSFTPPLMPEPSGVNHTAPTTSQAGTPTDEQAEAINDPGQEVMFNQPRLIDTDPLPASPEQLSDRVVPQSTPDALLPPVAAPAISFPATDPIAPAPELNPVVGTETEVHVHIGRIEVTAIQEAPIPKPAAPGKRQPMSLDDYLARRQRNHE